MKELRVVVIGQPNVGKSSLLNALVGSRVVVSNYPGTTVELIRAKKVIGDTAIYFEDTPGIYSISDRSEEEKITEKSLLEEKIDRAVVIADSTSFDRSLYLAFQILEARIPVIIALNFVEDAQKKGIIIDSEKLEELISVPVVPINPLNKKGINQLLDTILNYESRSDNNFTIKYDDDLENAIKEISPHISGTRLPERFVALRILEQDIDFDKYLEKKSLIESVREDLYEHHPRVYEDIAITRYGTACLIAEKVTQIITLRKGKGKLQDKIDGILLDNYWGLIVSGFSILCIFGILLFLGNWIQGSLMRLVENLISSLSTVESSIFNTLLVQGITGVAAGISIAFPYVFLFYLILGLLEDFGILSRFIVNAERFLSVLGLPGKAFIPLALGLGCTAPATTATRVVSSKKEQFHTASFFAFVPCSSRIAIIMGIVGYFGGIGLAFAVFLTLLITGLVWAFTVKKITHQKGEPLLIELPPYRRPLFKNVAVKSWLRMREFVYIVIPFLIIGCVAYGILEVSGLTNIIVEPLSPVTAWLGLPDVTIIPLIFGFLQKDLTGAMLISVVGTGVSSVLTPVQIYTFGLASTIGIPCIIALGMLVREFGFKKAIFLTAGSVFYGYIIAGLIWRVISLF